MTPSFTRIGCCLALSLLLVVTALPLQAQEPTPMPVGPTLQSVLSRGELSCGVDMELPGFGYLDPNTGGDPVGFEVELCRAIAAAIFGDAAAVIFPPTVNTQASLAGLRAGELDVAMNIVPWTMTMDAEGLEFGPPVFYSGQGIVVRVDSGAEDWDDLNGKTVCVVSGSVADADLIAYATTQSVTLGKLQLATRDAGWQALLDGQCEAMSDDHVQLANLRQQAADPASFLLWQAADQIYTREPYAPLMRYGDDQWANIVRWTLLGLIHAEQHGLSSETLVQLQRQEIDNLSAADIPTGTSEQDVARLNDEKYVLRVGGEVARVIDPVLGIGERLGLATNFMVPAITAVGNYGEIYNRNFGADKDLPLLRGLNALQADGGLLYAQDWR